MPDNKHKPAAASDRSTAPAPARRPRKKIADRDTAATARKLAKPVGAGRPRDIIARLLAALEYIARAKEPVTAAELSTALGIPRATAYRIFTRLEQEQILIPELGERGSAAGERLSDIAVALLANSTRHAARHRVLQGLVDEIGETCNLTTLCGSDVVYIDRVETHWPLRMHLSSGSRVPSHCTATGKLLLSLLPERQMNELIRAAPLGRYSDRTITDPDKLVAELARIRAEGVGIDNEEFAAGMVAVAVPVRDKNGRAIAALAVHAPVVRLPMEAARRHLPTLRKAATALSDLLE
jgi:IclR family transcriptional regulator, acetate operon repressor